MHLISQNITSKNTNNGKLFLIASKSVIMVNTGDLSQDPTPKLDSNSQWRESVGLLL